MGAKPGKGRGKFRQLCAQLVMLFFTKRNSKDGRLTDINSRAIDDFYYEYLDFDVTSESARRLTEVLDKLTLLLGSGKRKKLRGHEAIHLVLLVDSLLDDYTRSWEDKLAKAFDSFMEQFAKAKKLRRSSSPGEYWTRYGEGTRVNSDREMTIRTRHQFFAEKMLEFMAPLTLKDPVRAFGPLERELIYYRDHKRCAVCASEVIWTDGEIHHIERHSVGGPTVLANGVLVHRHCHPKSKGSEEALAEKLKKSGRLVQ